MKALKSNNFLKKQIKIKNFISPQNPNSFYQKIIFLTIIFIAGTYLLNLDKISLNTADIAGLLQGSTIVLNADKIKDTTAARPVKEVINWGKVTEYDKTKWTNRPEIDSSLKTQFPQRLSDIVEKYKYIPSNKIREQISNPTERETVLFYKRLLTTTWTASYDTTKLWIKDSGTHAGIDIISSVGTPVYSMANGIVLAIKTPCPGDSCNGFGNYIIVATNYEGMLIATFYAHLNSIQSNLKEGDIIQRGQQIGTIGSSGNSTAPHLHFQINKLGEVGEIKDMNVAKQLFEGWFHDIDGVKEKTYDPITFVEKKMGGNASSTSLASTIIEGDNTAQSVVAKDFKITDIKLSKIEKKIMLGDTIKATIYTTGSNGSISITTDNNVLKLSKYVVNYEGKNEYEIIINGNELGNGQMIFNDGTNKKIEYISVYKDNIDAVGIWVDGPDKIYKTAQSEFTIYPVDKLGNKVDTYLNGRITINLENQTNSTKTVVYDKTITDNLSVLKIYISAPRIATYKVSVSFSGNNKSYYASKTVSSDLFYDYSIHDEFGQAIGNLNDQGIVKGSGGKLMPTKTISKGEIITLLVRQKYGDDFEDFSDQMNAYLKKKGQFFKDITGKEWYAPYVYMGFRDGIAQGTNGKIQAEKAITKAELITLFGRNFGVSQNEVFTSWLDVNDSDWFKSYADAAKKYNLYPFTNLKNFKADETVKRISAFESLYRYLNFDTSLIPEVRTVSTVSTNNSSSSTATSSSNSATDKDKELEDAVRSIINY